MIDAKPAKRIRDPELLAALHRRWRECALCGSARPGRSLHHIHRHPRDDVEANLVMLCGHGTSGCHGDIESHDPLVTGSLRDYIDQHRYDTIEYLDAKLGGLTAATAWLDRYVPHSG